MSANNGQDHAYAPGEARPPSWMEGPHYRPKLHRAAALIRTAMDQRRWLCRHVAERLHPPCTESAVYGWSAARSVPGPEHRIALGVLFGIDPDLLLPEGETEEEAARRVAHDRARATVAIARAAGKYDGRSRSSGPEAATLAGTLNRTPASATAAPAVGPDTYEDAVDYRFHQPSGLFELRVVLRRPHQELQALLDLIGQDMTGRRITPESQS